MKNYNLLYGNVHYSAGYCGKCDKKLYDKNINLALKILDEQIKAFCSQYANEDYGIIFTEAYPNFESKFKAMNNEDYGIYETNLGEGQNPIVIITKNPNYEIVNQGINFLHIKSNSEKINLIGYRTLWTKSDVTFYKMLKYIINYDLVYSINLDTTQKSDLIKAIEELEANVDKKKGERTSTMYMRMQHILQNRDCYKVINDFFESLKKINIREKTLYETVFSLTEKYKTILYDIQAYQILSYAKNNIDREDKIILIGDFNFDNKYNECISLWTNYVETNDLIPCDNFTIGDRKLDYIYLKNCIKNKFDVFKTIEDLYFSKSKSDYISENIGNILSLQIKPPFPDHNLLFASINLGD